MANSIDSLDSLKEESIRIYPGITIVNMRGMQEEKLDMSSQVLTLDGCYAINNFTVCFITNNEAYVTPYTKGVIKILQSECFAQRSFYVPFSNRDYPKKEQGKWISLRNKAQKRLREEFTEACIYYCNENNIRELSDSTLKRCVKIPATGVEVEKDGKRSTYYPIISAVAVDYTVTNQIGRYSANNGVVVFTYRDGETYVTKGYKILEELRKAGYREALFFVPFANGEEIKNGFIKNVWNLIYG